MASRFRAFDFVLLGAPALACFSLWWSKQDAKHLAPLREQPLQTQELQEPATLPTEQLGDAYRD